MTEELGIVYYGIKTAYSGENIYHIQVKKQRLELEKCQDEHIKRSEVRRIKCKLGNGEWDESRQAV